MTATTHDLFANLVEGHTYQVSTSRDGLGGTRWQLMRYQRFDGELVWLQVATCTSATPEDGRYRDTARGWLRSLGHNPDEMDLILILPDGIERSTAAVGS